VNQAKFIGAVAAMGMRAKLRGLRTSDGVPLFTQSMQGTFEFCLDEFCLNEFCLKPQNSDPQNSATQNS
jgi:hypothetical protein